MPITINGSGTITGLSVGGLPDGTVDAGTLASGTVSNTGKILQTVVANSTDRIDTNSTSWTATHLTATITPSATSSKVLILCSGDGNTQGGNIGIYITLYRDSTNLGHSTEGKQILYCYGSRVMAPMNFNHWDSPSSTSALVYKIYARAFGNGSANEWPSQDTNSSAQLILMEIAG